MAERRMFSKSVIDSDAFADMSAGARLLYYDLSMRADDDGFVNSPKRIARMTGVPQDAIDELAKAGFVIAFDSGVVAVRHWKIHNYIRKDTYRETNYREEKALLETDETGLYALRQRSVNDTSTDCQRSVNGPSTQDSTGKDSTGKDSTGKDSADKDSTDKDSTDKCCKGESGEKEKSDTAVANGGDDADPAFVQQRAERFRPPAPEEVEAYCDERGNGIDARHFVDYYSSNGWKVGRNPMKDWKAAVRSWEQNGYGGSRTRGENSRDAPQVKMWCDEWDSGEEPAEFEELF